MARRFDIDAWRIAAATGAALAAGGYLWYRRVGLTSGTTATSGPSGPDSVEEAGVERASGKTDPITAPISEPPCWFSAWTYVNLDAAEEEVAPPNATLRVVRLRFQLPVHHEGEMLPVAAGQSIELRWLDPSTGEYSVRGYTPIQIPVSVPELPAKSSRRRSLVDHQSRAERSPQPGFFELLVKVYPNDGMSYHLAELAPTDRIEMRGPVGGSVVYPRTPTGGALQISGGLRLQVKSLLLIAGGTGITPMFQILMAITSNPQDVTTVSLLYASRTEHDILLKSQLDVLRREFPNVSVFYTVDEVRSEGFSGCKGRVSRAMIDSVAPAFDDCAAIICGPRAMELAVETLLKEETFSQGHFPSDRVFVVG